MRKLRPNAKVCALRRNGSERSIEVESGLDLVVDNIDDALAFQPNAAIVAGPAPSHVSLARKLVLHDIDVFIEKPLSTQLEDAMLLADEVRSSSSVVMVGYNLRFLKSLQQFREILLSGRIGAIQYLRAEVGQYLPDWRPNQTYQDSVSARKELGGGVLLELSHELDYVCWLFGMPDRVTARGGRFSTLQLDVEDSVELVLEYDSPRRLVSIHLDMLDRSVQRHCRACGELGTMTWNANQGRVRLFDGEQRQWSDLPSKDAVEGNQMYIDELTHFLDCISTRKKP